MAPRKSHAVAARARAHEKYAARQAAQAVRDRANMQDLTAFYRLQEMIRDHDDAIDDLRRQQGAHLAALNDRGQAISDIAVDTGLEPSEVKRLLNLPRPATAGSRHPTGRAHLSARATSADAETSRDPGASQPIGGMSPSDLAPHDR